MQVLRGWCIFADVKKYIYIVTTLLLLSATSATAEIPVDTLHRDIEQVEITAAIKSSDRRATPISTTSMTMLKLEERGVSSVKELTAIAPNFYQPDYGSSITSSIYVRGFGSRIDQPVLGITLDNVPLMNKNSFDFDFYDIRRVELLRGPQGTLYGRNTSGGVMNITTLSPMVWQGVRAMAEYSTATSARASVGYYARPTDNFGISIAAGFNHDGGHFVNEYTDEMCDRGNSGSVRVRLLGHKGLWDFDNSLSVGYTNEGGYAYHNYTPETGITQAVNYNDPSGYERLTINEGFVARYHNDNISVSSITSYQYLDDCMTLDQDFSTKSMFTMQQMQREHTLTEEIVIRNANNKQNYQWLSGVFIFGKLLDMSSPVTFKEDGINELILGNINNGLHTVFPNNNMMFGVDNFVIASDFRIPTAGAALYHQSSYDVGDWCITAGIRFDYEQTSMHYHSHATVPYCFDLTMSDYKDLRSDFKGKERQHFFEILPKIAVEYNLYKGNIYATITRGYKSGGYNTQIFSDILQVQMMNDMMDALGVALDGVGTATYDSASATKYKPETSWNFEVGTHLKPIKSLTLDASLFWIECFDQQVTVLPQGNNTGRMMSNAARARSFGVELSAEYVYEGLNIRADYGYTNARFRDYDDGTANYAGNYLPYAPQNTAAVMASYTWGIHNKHLQQISIAADWRGIGSIYWNESNSLRQDFYSLLGAQLMLRMSHCTLSLWGRNLLNSDYNVFYFKSVGKEFFSKGKPLQLGVRVSVNI